MSLPSYGSVLKIRHEVLDPRSLLDMVDLALVSGKQRRGLGAKVPGIETLRDPVAFFGITYPTAEIVEVLRTLSQRAAAPESVPGTILLSGRYGHGKSHVLLAAHHALNAPEVVRGWADRWKLDAIELPATPVVVTRSFIQHADEPLWEMLVSALCKGRKPKVGDFLDGEAIQALLGDQPVFVIMDELERWYDAQDERNKSRNRNFLQALTEVSMRDGRLTLLTSVLGEKEEPAETIRRVRPLEMSFRSAADRQRVALYRLFSNRDESEAKRAAEAAADAYVQAYTDAGIRNLDGLHGRMKTSWPFTPEFLDILTKKVPNLGGFQNTRGTLRFLAHVVRHTHEKRPIVSSQDLPFKEDAVHQALSNLDVSGGEVVRRALGDNYDVVSSSLPHRDELFSALVFYSIADPTHPGATLDELLLATLDPGENPIRIRDALAQLKQCAFNLHERDERFVFLAVENPHARINAMASSQLVTRQAAQDDILSTLQAVWSGHERTAVFTGEWDETQRRLRELRSKRPRIVLSTEALSPEERLRIQNLDEDRNLVLLVEPRPRTSTGEHRYRLLSDDALIHHARRIEACRLLLEGRPAEEAAEVYRHVRDHELGQLKKAVGERYGVAISWHRAGATGTQVDGTWYDVCRLETPSAEALTAMWAEDLTGLPEIRDRIGQAWKEFRKRSVTELAEWFDRTPGLPVPLEEGWVPSATRSLATEGRFSLVAPDGAALSPKRIATISDTDLRSCTISDPVTHAPDDEDEEQEPIIHPNVAAQYDAGRRGVLVSWRFPPLPPTGGRFSTLVQRYTTARNWEVGRQYPIDTGETHEANRYQGDEESFVDTDRVQPGEWYLYYVFLAYTVDARTTYTLSGRADVHVPRPGTKQEGVIETSVHTDPNKLVGDVERLVMSGKHMSSESRVRKIEVRIGGVSASVVREHLGGRLAEKHGTNLEASADLTLVLRGEFNRQEIISTLRLLPKHEGASYTASLYLKAATEPGQES